MNQPQDRISASAGRPTCVVRGSINHDEYFYVHHIARPGETISSYGHESRVGGKGANQAVAVARAGGAVRFYGTIGEDGLWIKERMERWGIGVEGISVGDDPTGRAIIQVDEEGENSIILFPGANHSELHETLFSRHTSPSSPPPGLAHSASASRSPASRSPPPSGWFPPATHLLLQNEISRASTYYALQHARPGTTVVLNPSPLPSDEEIREFMWHRVDWLLVNEREASGLYGALTGRGGGGKEGSARASSSPRINSGGGGGSGSGSGSGSRAGSAIGSPTQTLSNRELIARLSALPAFANVNIVCTLGADGVLAFVPAFHRPRTPVEAPSFMHLPAARLVGGVKDTTGAGDTFAGYFVAGLMEFGEGAWVGRAVGVGRGGGARAEGRGREIKEADVVRLLKVCVQAAGMCVEKSGTIESIPTRAQVEERMATAMSA